MIKLSKLKKLNRIISLVSIFLLVILSIPVYFLLTKPGKSVEASWMDESFSFRTPITFGNSGGVVSNQKVSFTIDTSTLISNGKMQSNCYDTRFTDSAGLKLKYYLASGCNTATTVYWVLFPTITAGTNTLYHYYGNPTAPTGTQATQFSETTFSPNSGPTGGSESVGASPIGWWGLNDKSGTTAQDSTNGNRDGALTSATFQSPDNCKVDGCVNFDGTSDYITLPTVPTGSSTTLSAWIKTPTWDYSTNATGITGIVAKGSWGADSNGDIRIILNSTGTNYLSVHINTSTTNVIVTYPTDTNLNTNQWYLVTAVYSSSEGNLKLYINGKLVGQKTVGGTFTSNSNTVAIGAYPGNLTNTEFKGFIDEVKIYQYARSETQIKTDYISGMSGSSSPKGVGVASGGLGINSDTLTNGLTGYWNLDEASGDATDYSGNTFTGTVSGTPTRENGKFGRGITFDGTDDNVNMGDVNDFNGNTTMSVGAWIYPTTTPGVNGAQIVSKFNRGSTGEWDILLTSTMRIYFNRECGSFGLNTENNAISLNKWQYVAGTYDGTNLSIYIDGKLSATKIDSCSVPSTSEDLIIGAGDNGAGVEDVFTGTIDDVRVYNRSLGANEVKFLYEWAPGPIGYWKFDEANGTTVSDNSGYGNSGVLVAGATLGTGKFGKALYTSNANQHATITDSTSLDSYSDQFTMSAWIKPIRQYGPSEADQWFLFLRRAGLQVEFGYSGFGTGENVAFKVWNNASGSDTAYDLTSSSATIYPDRWYHYAGVKEGNVLKLYLNGVLVGKSENFTGTLNSGGDIYISGDSSTSFNGYLDEVKIYNYARNSKQITEDMNGNRPEGGNSDNGSTIYWGFDEMSGTTAKNFVTSQQSLTGTISGASWTTANNCKVNGCIYIDTNSDSVSGGDTYFPNRLLGFSTTMWIKPQTLSTNADILSKSNLSNDNTFHIRTDGTNSDEIRVYVASSTNDTSNYFTTSNLDLANGTWSSLGVTYDASASANQRVKVYKNGKRVDGSITGTIPSSGLVPNSNSNLKLGDSDSAGSNALLAYYDEVKLFSGALSESDIAKDANAGSANAFGGVLGTHDDEGFGGNPPVGWWKMEEGTGTTAKDTSGNGFNSSTFTGTTNWGVGKNGKGLIFNGNNDVVRITESSLLDLGGVSDSYSVSAWFKTSNNAATSVGIVMKNIAATFPFILYLNSSEQACFSMRDGTNTVSMCTSGTYNDNKWHHITGVRNTTTDTAYLYIDGGLYNSTNDTTTSTLLNNADIAIGNGDNASYNGSPFVGSIDEVKIYNYARTQAQVAYDYNRGAPIGWWEMDECTGSVIYDSSGNNLSGTLSGLSSGTNTTFGSCNSGSGSEMWNNGTSGKINSALSFDGNNDNVTVNDNDLLDFSATDSFSVSVWVKYSAQLGAANYPGIVSKANNVAIHTGYNINVDTGGGSVDNFVYFDIGDGTNKANLYSRSALNDNRWHHVVGTVDRSTQKLNLYIDGTNAKTPVNTSSVSTIVNSNNLRFGSRAGSNFYTGLIDDVRIYRYPLSESQIQTLYNLGSVMHFGPNEGIP